MTDPFQEFLDEVLQNELEIYLPTYDVQTFWKILFELWCNYKNHRKDTVRYIKESYIFFLQKGYFSTRRADGYVYITKT